MRTAALLSFDVAKRNAIAPNLPSAVTNINGVILTQHVPHWPDDLWLVVYNPWDAAWERTMGQR